MSVVVCKLVHVTINLSEPKQLLLSNGGPAGNPLPAGDYVAISNVGQQPGWYSLYSADPATGQQTGDKLANVFLAIGAHGNVYIEA